MTLLLGSKPWTPEEAQFLTLSHSTLTAREQAEHLTKPYHVVIEQRMELYRQGAISTSQRAYLPRWTRENDEYLEAHYSRRTMKTLCRKLGRSPTAIVMRKRRLGLHRTDGFYTATALGEIFGIDSKQVAWFADEGFLKGSRAPYRQGNHKPRYFSELSVRRFIRGYPWLLRPEKMREHHFRSILRDEWRRDPWYTPARAARLLGIGQDTPCQAARRGDLVGHQRQPGKRWSKWYFRKSDLEGWWRGRHTTRSEKARASRLRLFKRRGLPMKVATIWEVECPGCGEAYRLEASPKAHSPDVLRLAAVQHRCNGAKTQKT